AALDPTSDPAPPPLEVAVPAPSQDLPAAPDQGVHSNGGIPCVD
ncbi:MAG: LytR family transcriptional regulator, partial [Rhodococcus sp. (in: high G+C Gram-positive bacteria)]